jgi:Peptidase family M48
MSNVGKPISKSYVSSCVARIAKNWSFYLKRFCLGIGYLFILQFSDIALAQTLDNPVTLSNQDVLDTISAFKTDNPSKFVEQFKAKMPIVSDQKTREIVLNDLPRKILELQIKDEKLEENIRTILKPLLCLYGRENAYKLIIFKHNVPFAAIDSGSVILISTGYLGEIESDDELVGTIAHEIGHEYFTQYSVYTKYLLNLLKTNGNETALARKFGEILSIIELQCDAFSALTLAHLGFDSTAFIDGIDRMAKKYKAEPNTFHPKEIIRRHVIEGVIPNSFVKKDRRKVSQAFKEIKQILIAKTSDTLGLVEVK